MIPVTSQLPTIATVLGAAAIDSINPCAIGVLILIISILITQRHSVKRMLLLGGIYILAIYLTYLAAGLGLVYGLSKIPQSVAEYISIAVGAFVILAGLLEIKDFFWYGRWFTLGIPVGISKRLHRMAQSYSTSIVGLSLLGAFVAGVELPCTGAVYLAIITLLSQFFNFQAFVLLLIYNVIFVLPLVVILVLVAAGRQLFEIQRFRMEGRGVMRLAIGILLVAMGWLLMLIANGTVNLG